MTTRKEFIKMCGLLGLSAPFYQLSALSRGSKKSKFYGHVIIVGAGAAGLSAGYLLEKEGVDFTILEASTSLGGRMKTDNDFADFPIPLGAEWITSDMLSFGQLIDHEAISEKIETIGYTQNDEYGIWSTGKLIRGNLGALNYRKFFNNSWLDFFQEFIIPAIEGKITFQTPVKSIDYSDSKIKLSTTQSTYEADYVILTVPPSILQMEKILFSPPLPRYKLKAISKTLFWDGFKAFIAFQEKFYPAFVDFIIHPETDGQVAYYDASFGQYSSKNILGLFSVGNPAQVYCKLSSDDLRDYVLKELDEIFDNQATPNYIKHVSQNWSSEPFIQGAYVSDFADPGTVSMLQEPVESKLFFAGDSYTDGNDWGNVHNAINSARQSVSEILKLTVNHSK